MRYVATDGAESHEWNGVPTLILTTTGRKSGKRYSTPLIYQPYGDALLVVASKGGSDTPPERYLNLQTNPEVGVQVMADRSTATARTTSADEKAEMWPVMTAVWPDYDKYQKSTSREIPVIVLDRV